MSHLTILNPNKLLEQVADAIDQLQTLLKIKLSNRACFWLICTYKLSDRTT